MKAPILTAFLILGTSGIMRMRRSSSGSGRFKIVPIPPDLREVVAAARKSAIATAASVTLPAKPEPIGPLGAPCRKSAT